MRKWDRQAKKRRNPNRKRAAAIAKPMKQQENKIAIENKK